MTHTAMAHATPIAAALHHSEFLSFTLGAEEYGVEILKVQEIRGYEEPTHIANAPEFIKGVVNLRGIRWAARIWCSSWMNNMMQHKWRLIPCRQYVPAARTETNS